MRDEIPSSLGAQDMDTTWYQVFDLHDIEFYSDYNHLVVDAVFRPGIDTPFYSTWFDGDGSFSGKTQFCMTEKRTRRTLLPQHQSLRPTRPPALLRSHPFATRRENNFGFVYMNLPKQVLPFMWSTLIYKLGVSLYNYLFQKLIRHLWDKSI